MRGRFFAAGRMARRWRSSMRIDGGSSAEATRSGSYGRADASLQPTHRAGIRCLDSAVRGVSWQASSPSARGAGSNGLCFQPGNPRCERVHQESGAQCDHFLYEVVLSQCLAWMNEIVRARRPARLPVVLSRDEVLSLLSRLRGPVWLMAWLMYGARAQIARMCRAPVEGHQFRSW